MAGNYPIIEVDKEFSSSAILLIDDCHDNLELLQATLEAGGFTNVHATNSGALGLLEINRIEPELVILDLMMPGIDGFKVLEQLRDECLQSSFIPVLVYTADLGDAARKKALELGACDFLTKPGNVIEILLRVRNFLRMKKMHTDLENQNRILEAKVKLRTQHLTVARKEAIEVLSSVSEYHDDLTGQHAKRVGELCASIAQRLKLEPQFIDSIRLAAQLHDIGKVSIPLEILLKKGKLTESEMEVVKGHAKAGADLIGDRQSPLLRLARELAMHHHERWDGKGYPSELKGEDIPVSARIVAVADAFDAMVSDRPYRIGCTHAEALEELAKCAGVQFDPQVVSAIHEHFGVTSKGKSFAAA